MDIDIYSIRKFDSNGLYKLDECYMLSYSHCDGWNERGLNFDFFVDIYFDCFVRLSFLDRNITRIDSQFSLELPLTIRDLILSLINLDKLELKFLYADTFMEDSGEEIFVINHNNISHNVCIGILEKKIIPSNLSEELFFKINKELEKFREETYTKYKN
jgi:hypothetical protein